MLLRSSEHRAHRQKMLPVLQDGLDRRAWRQREQCLLTWDTAEEADGDKGTNLRATWVTDQEDLGVP